MKPNPHHDLIEGRADVPRLGSVAKLETQHPPYAVLTASGEVVEPALSYLRDLALSDNSPLTGRSYAHDLLRWFRLLWFLDLPWDKASEAEAAAWWAGSVRRPIRSGDGPTRHRPRQGRRTRVRVSGTSRLAMRRAQSTMP